MTTSGNQQVTELLLAWNQGSQQALDQLIPLVYDELRRLARSYLRREGAAHTMQTTALVHEAYVRLVDSTRVHWHDRTHFYGIAARVMRRVLVDLARARGAAKRGGDVRRVSFDEALDLSVDQDADLVALDEALVALAALDDRKSQVVEMRFFGGLSVEETAEALGISVETVHRDWRFAKSWLLRELSGEAGDGV